MTQNTVKAIAKNHEMTMAIVGKGTYTSCVMANPTATISFFYNKRTVVVTSVIGVVTKSIIRLLNELNDYDK